MWVSYFGIQRSVCQKDRDVIMLIHGVIWAGVWRGGHSIRLGQTGLCWASSQVGGLSGGELFMINRCGQNELRSYCLLIGQPPADGRFTWIVKFMEITLPIKLLFAVRDCVWLPAPTVVDSFRAVGHFYILCK